MSVRIVMTKTTGQGEQVQIDIPSWNPVTGVIEYNSISEMSKAFDEVTAITDIRLQDMNLRLLEAYDLKKYCSGEVWSKVVDILDILSGKQTADTVSRRWQSSIEETAELEAGREAVYDEMLREAANSNVQFYDGKEY